VKEYVAPDGAVVTPEGRLSVAVKVTLVLTATNAPGEAATVVVVLAWLTVCVTAALVLVM
jgi:hypothetical protein